MHFAGDPMLAVANTGTANAGTYSVIVSSPYGSVTSSIAMLTAFLPPQSFMISHAEGQQINLQFTGTSNYPYILQAATNLTPPVNWQSVLTNPADANGNWEFTVTNLSANQKFYRVEGQ